MEPRPIANLLPNVSPGVTPRPSSAKPPSAERLTVQPNPVMRRIWLRMAEIYGHRWTSAYGDDADGGAALTWAKGLSGIPVEQIAAGIESALVSADGWPPTLPEFRALCLGIPTLAAAKLALNDKTNGFARLMWMRMDRFAVRTASQERADQMVAGAYEMAREHVMRGGALPPEPLAEIAKEEPKRGAVSPAVAKKAFAELDAILGTPDAEQAA